MKRKPEEDSKLIIEAINQDKLYVNLSEGIMILKPLQIPEDQPLASKQNHNKRSDQA